MSTNSMTAMTEIGGNILKVLRSGNFTEAQQLVEEGQVDRLWLAYIEARQQEYTHPDKARSLYLEVAENTQERILTAAALCGAGICIGQVLGQFEEGLALLEKALLFADTYEQRSIALNNRAAIIGYAVHTGNFPVGRLHEAIDIWLQLWQEWPEDESNAGNLGVAYFLLGEFQKAEYYQRQSIAIIEENGVGGPSMASSLMNLGESLLGQEKFQDALAQFTEAQRIIIDYPNADPVLSVEIARNLARTYQHVGELSFASTHGLQAIDEIEARREQLGEEHDRLSFLAMLLDAYNDAIEIALEADDIGLAFTLTERARSRTMSESLQIETPLSCEEIQAALPTNRPLVSYYALKDSYVIFLVTHEAIWVERLALSSDELTRAFDFDGYPQHIMPASNGKLQRPWVLERIGKILTAPLAAHLTAAQQGEIETLCIIPYGSLNYLPFQLWLPQPIVYAPSATLFLTHCQQPFTKAHERTEDHLAEGEASKSSMLAYGYNSTDLTHAEIEARNIANQLGGTAFLSEGASRANLRSGQWLHFSCHGVHNVEDPLESHLLLADGPLTAREIMQMSLNAELVTLSACESGRNQIHRGDESIGLTRAFFAAGASSVLVSLWPVDEVATRLLMEQFYHELSQGKSKSDALFLAQQQLRTYGTDELPTLVQKCGQTKGKAEQIAMQDDGEHPFAHPYWWAGFVLVGDRI